MVANIRNHIQRIGQLTTRIPGRMVKSVAEHQVIYEAIVHRDGAAAETAMRRHILSVMADQLVNIGDATEGAARDAIIPGTRLPSSDSQSAERVWRAERAAGGYGGILRSSPRGGNAGQLDAPAGFGGAELDPGHRCHAAERRQLTVHPASRGVRGDTPFAPPGRGCTPA